jgi:hypothetical protein
MKKYNERGGAFLEAFLGLTPNHATTPIKTVSVTTGIRNDRPVRSGKIHPASLPSGFRRKLTMAE